MMMSNVKLYQHQIDILNVTSERCKVGYFLDMGLGKTFVGSEKLERLGGKTNLVICQKSKVDDWVSHFREHYAFAVYDLTDKCEYELFVNAISPHINVGVVNYDLIYRRKELLDITYDTVMLDESSLVQNPTAKRSKAVMRLKQNGIILLSGTVCGGKYENLWSQLKLLGLDMSKTEYWDTFVETRSLDMGGFRIPIVTGYKNVGKLKRMMRRLGCHFLKTDEVFDLPEQTFTDVRIAISKEYKTFRKDGIVEVGDRELIGDTVLTQMLYERQLCGAYSADKLTALRDILDSTDDRVIVFYNFDEELKRIIEVCKGAHKSISQVNGKVKDLKAYDADEHSVTLIQYQSGAMGLNLQKSNKIVYYTPPLSSELYEQSKKRIHRIGQERPCFYWRLVCMGSVEKKIYQTLEMRQDFTEELFKKGAISDGC